jgi:hypothetical protein
MKKALIIILMVFAAVFLASAYFLGIFPFNNAKDLGVRYTNEDFERSLSKVGGRLEALPKDTPKEKSIQMNGILNVDTSFTDEELTAAADSRKWIYYPVKDPQIKIHDDGTLEASAQIRTSRLMDYALATNTPKYYTDLIDKFDILPNPPVYIKGKGYVENNKITIENLEEGEVGRIKLEGEMLDAVGKELKYFIEDGIKRTPGLDVNKLTFENGEMDLKGTIPAVESSVNE